MQGISENGFCIFANRRIVFRCPFSLETEKVKDVTLAAITLHNWLWKDLSYRKVYIPSELVDNENIATDEITEGGWRNHPLTESWYSMSVTKAIGTIKNVSRNADFLCEICILSGAPTPQ